MGNEKLSLAKWIAAAACSHQSLSEFLKKRAAEELDTGAIALEAKMEDMLTVMEESIRFGLTGIRSHSGLTGGSGRKLQEYLQQAGSAHLLGILAEDAVTYSLAVAECNAAMGRIVAAPTAGASGVLPGVLFALQKHEHLSRVQLVQALIVAGSIGEVIASRASLAGATGGCQAECGSAAAMAAGAAVVLMGGNGEQVGIAVSIVFKNILGLVCDPVAGLVEVPCIKRNGSCAVQALLGAQLALSGVGSFIPVDEAIDAMNEVGHSLPCRLRETAGGGMAATPTAKEWAKKYFGQNS